MVSGTIAYKPFARIVCSAIRHVAWRSVRSNRFRAHEHRSRACGDTGDNHGSGFYSWLECALDGLAAALRQRRHRRIILYRTLSSLRGAVCALRSHYDPAIIRVGRPDSRRSQRYHDGAYRRAARPWPHALAGGVLIFSIFFRELVGSVLLRPAGVQTVSTFILREFDQGSPATGMAVGVIAISVSLASISLARRLVPRRT